MADNYQKRDGSWAVELYQPIKYGPSDIGSISFKPVTLEHAIRWGQGEIASTLALMSELSGVPELVLRQLQYPDFDRVMFAFMSLLPGSVRADMESNRRPFATPRDELKAEAMLNPEAKPVDQQDPRFPATVEPVKRFEAPPVIQPRERKVAETPGEVTGFSTAPPETMRAAKR